MVRLITEEGGFLCPCGGTHWAEVQLEKEFLIETLNRLGDMVDVAYNGKVYQLSRIFIAFHGLKGPEIPTESVPKYGSQAG